MLIRLYFMLICMHVVHSCVLRSSLKCVKGGTMPEQIRIALRPSFGITVSWKSYGKVNETGLFKHTYGINDTPNPTVKYSTFSDFSSYLYASGGSTNYDNSSVSSWFHNVPIAVELSKTYYYQIMASDCTVESDIFTFKMPPVKGDKTPLNIVIVGDLGTGTETGRRTIEVLNSIANGTDLFIHVGDISYADDHPVPTPGHYEESWNKFQNSIQPLTSQKFYMTAPGNHEATCFQGKDVEICKDYLEGMDLTPYRNFSAYLHRFRMPGKESNGFGNMWYSFDYGMVHFAIIDTETDFDGAPAGPRTDLNGGNFAPNGTQWLWLQNDLEKAQANREAVPWIIVAGHRPFFGSRPVFTNSSYGENCPACQAAFAALIYHYDVDFYFCGHVHWFERLFPVNANGTALARNYNNQPGTIYVTSGAGGAPEPVQEYISSGKVNASSVIKSHYGYVNLSLLNATHSELSFIGTQQNRTINKQLIDRRGYKKRG